MTTTVPDVLDALTGVRDPELDQNLVELGFVTDVQVDGAIVGVRLRLPTYFCAPNFAFLMVADARRAVEGLAGVDVARIALEDHFTAGEINEAVGRDATFTEAFPGEARGELDDLRALFRRKALTARQGRLCDGLLAGPDADRCRELRHELGYAAGPGAPAFVLADGAPLTAGEFARFLRFARLVARSLDGNAHLCRGLLKTRYDLTDHEEVAA
jgi:metal-sulfur cluster biosynthetic enzyme